MSEWQPIETAPQDGTLIDIWTQWGRLVDCSWKHHDWLNGKPITEKSWFPADKWDFKAMYWMPAPKPPGMLQSSHTPQSGENRPASGKNA